MWPGAARAHYDMGLVVDRIGAVADYRCELIGHQVSGSRFVELNPVTLVPDAQPYASFQHLGRSFSA